MPSPIVVTGLIVDEASNPVTSGYVEFELSPLNQGLAYEIPNVCVIAKSVRGLIDATGHVKGIDGVSPLTIWPNDLILPSNTLYTVTIAPNNKVTRVYNNVLLQSSVDPQDLSFLTFILPQPVIGTVIEGSPLVTESVIPAVDLAYTLGDPQHRYTHVYAQFLDNLTQNLTVDELHVTGFIDNPLGELLLQDIVRITGRLKLLDCVNFYAAYPADFTSLCPQAGGPFAVQLPADSGVLALLNSPVFTGTPQAPTPLPADNSNKLATTAFVQAFVAPTSPVTSVFGRIGAIAAVVGDYDVSEVTGAAPLASPTFTGDPKAPTPATADNDTSVATTAFVRSLLADPSAFAGFAISKLASGYIKLPASLGGLIIQWITGGNDAAGEFQTTKNWPIAFPTSCLWVGVSMKGPSTNANDSWYQVVSYSTTQIVLFKQGTGGTTQITQALCLGIGY